VWTSREELEAGFRRGLVDESKRLILAGEAIGYVSFGRSRDADAAAATGEVISIFVAPEHWRSGIGGQLMSAAIDELGELGYGEATLWSLAGNARANDFYEAQGFRRDGAERHQDTWAELPQVRYRRSLPG
jgi:GNAT superfamily N-acetyltransferase